MATKKEKRILVSYLEVLLAHLIKWYSQPDKRSWNWIGSINFARREILKLFNLAPSVKPFLDESIDKALPEAIKQAEKDMHQPQTMNLDELKNPDLLFNQEFKIDDDKK